MEDNHSYSAIINFFNRCLIPASSDAKHSFLRVKLGNIVFLLYKK